jgi:mannose-1-phosphate guanylyltransferase
VWNAGMFIFSVKTFKKELEKHQSRLAEQFEEGMSLYYSEAEPEFIRKVYGVCKNISVDVGIMEKSKDVKVVLADIGWSDLGTWKSLYEVQEKDQQQNVIDANALVYNTNNTIIKASNDKLIVVNGLNDFIVVENDNVIMICPKEKEQDVKQFVEDATGLDGRFS